MKYVAIATTLCALAAMFSGSTATAQTPKAGATVCRANNTIAASVYGTWMGSGGDTSNGNDQTVVKYANVVANIGKAWDTINQDAFTAPCSGTFTISVALIRDSVTTNSTCGPTPGTTNDVYIQIWRKPSGGDSVLVGSYLGAWVGWTDSTVRRAAGAYVVTTALAQGDQVYTEVGSDGGGFRCLASASLDIHKIGR